MEGCYREGLMTTIPDDIFDNLIINDMDEKSVQDDTFLLFAHSRICVMLSASQSIDDLGDVFPPPSADMLRFRIDILESKPGFFSLLSRFACSGLTSTSLNEPGSMCDLGNNPNLLLAFVPDQHQWS